MGYLTYIGTASPYYTSVNVGNVVEPVVAVPGQTQHFDDGVSAALLAAQPTFWQSVSGFPSPSSGGSGVSLGGDLGGTNSAPVVETVLGGQPPVVQFQTMAGAAAPDGFKYDPITFLGVVDPIWKIGYNPDGAVSSEPQFYIGIEGDYKIAAGAEGWNDGNTHLKHEFYINYESPDGTSVVNFRPIYVGVRRDSNASHAAIMAFDIGTDSFPFSQLQINAGSTPIALFTPTGLRVQAGMVLQLNGVNVLQNSALLIEPGKGLYYEGQTNLTTSVSFGNGTLRLSPVFIPVACTLEGLFIDFTVAGDAASVYVPCVYGDNGSMYPGSLLATGPSISTGSGNAGAVATGGTPGVYATAISLAVQPGWYWIGGVVQGVTTTQPTLREGAFGTPAVGSNVLPAAGAQQFGYSQASVTGALPATFTATVTPTAIVPRVGFQVA